MGSFWSNYSDLTRPHPKWWFSKGNPLVAEKPRLVKFYKYYNLARNHLGVKMERKKSFNMKLPTA